MEGYLLPSYLTCVAHKGHLVDPWVKEDAEELGLFSLIQQGCACILIIYVYKS